VAPALVALLFLAAPARAPAREAPLLVPRSDVAVTYRSEQRGLVLEQRMRFSATLHRVRIDPPTPGMFVLVDQSLRRMWIVREASRSYVEMSAPGAAAASVPGMAGVAPAAEFTRGGDDRVAGFACTEWTVTARAGQTATLCITPDGLLLRVRLGETVLAEASAVDTARQDAALFEVPAGYSPATPPHPAPP
jgi:hypothetical protein